MNHAVLGAKPYLRSISRAAIPFLFHGHLKHHEQPLAQRDFGTMEDAARHGGELLATGLALPEASG